MAGKSSIEWTEHTWNPIVGCSVLSPGCTNCYAMNMAARIEAMASGLHYAGTTKRVNGNAVWTGKIKLAPRNILLGPLRRKKPTVYFVNSMGDLFHEDAPDAWIDKVFAVMALCPQHTFQVLTKRAERMRDYFRKLAVEACCEDGAWAPRRFDQHAVAITDSPCAAGYMEDVAWPLPNVWLGVSAERQKEADERIPLLLQTPAAVRFVSAEPLLGPLDLEPWLAWPENAPDLNGNSWGCQGCDSDCRCDCPNEKAVYTATEGPHDPATLAPKWIHQNRETLDWVIVGGESGPNARPFDIAWGDGIVDQCRAADVPCFVKQLGGCPISSGYPLELESAKGGDIGEWPDSLRVRQFPAGRTLDSSLHSEMPRGRG